MNSYGVKDILGILKDRGRHSAIEHLIISMLKSHYCLCLCVSDKGPDVIVACSLCRVACRRGPRHLNLWLEACSLWPIAFGLQLVGSAGLKCGEHKPHNPTQPAFSILQ